MELLEIALALAGLVIIIVSVVLTDKRSGGGVQEIEIDTKAIDRMMEEKQLKLEERIEHSFTEKEQQAAVLADEELSRISNEKIMAVNEFSNQVLEKIEMNHKEVVFLYDMLNEKEKQIKELISQAEKEKAALEDALIKEAKARETKEPSVSAVRKEKQARPKREKEEGESKKKEETEHGSGMTGQQALKAKKEAFMAKAKKPVETIGGVHNEEILRLYQEGKSVTEISKALGQGQGEVKLVIDLFLGTERTPKA